MDTSTNTLAYFFIIMTLLFTSTTVSANSKQFLQGKQYFNKQEYKLATNSFQKALDSGDRRAVIYYNLAVSEYKLGQYNRAEQHFKKIAHDKKFSNLATYNIGLINTKKKQYKRAKQWFGKVSQKGNNDLYKRAQRMIRNINNEGKSKGKTTAKVNKAKGLLMLTLGNDDNVNRVSDSSPTNINDNFYITYVSGSIPLTFIDNALYFGASNYAIKYSGLSTNDFNVLRGNIGYKHRLDKWKTKSVLSYASSNLAGASYQDSIRLSLNGQRRIFSQSTLKLAYKYDDISSSNILNNHLDGWRQQLRLSYRTRLSSVKVEARYKLELNNRNDKATESFSPTRHSIRGIASKSIANLWTLGTDITYRNSDYPSVAGVAGRTEDRLLSALFARYRINKDWNIEAKYQNTSNHSNKATFQYNRNEISINTAYIF